MNALEDTRELVTAVATDDARAERGLYARAASAALFALLVDYPDVELATLQFRIDSDDPPKVTVTGRRGPLTPTDECASCHTTAGHPHTDYCTLAPEHPTGLHPLQPDCTAACWPEPATGPPCYTLNPDGTTNAATQCIDPECRYPNPHTHPDLIG